MANSSRLLDRAVDAFSSLPGIGRKSAMRLVLHLLEQDLSNTEQFCHSLLDLRKNIQYCRKCHYLSDQELCNICLDNRRDHKKICVVENIPDVMAIEDTGQFQGVYHVLGGVISPVEGRGPEKLELESLIQRCESEDIEELIMAISPTIDGETTVFYIANQLEGTDISISQLSRGIAFGGELVYTDGLTLGRSILSRTPYSTPNP
jgi:recombination protein RecR